MEVTPNPRGFTLLAFGVALLGFPAYQLLQMPPNMIAQRLLDMLRM